MTNIRIENKLGAVHAGKASRLYPLITAKTRRIDGNAAAAKTDMLWPVEWWGLERCELFARLGKNERHEALTACNRGILNEAYFIEKSGLAYCAKMMLLADSTDSAQLFAHIAADEATHLAWIEPYIAEQDKTSPQGQFLSFLSGLIEEHRPELLIYLVQVILEGWGLDHYKRLMKNCQDPALTRVLRRILKDEALHHHSGTLLHDASKFSARDRGTVADAMKFYAELVRVGPQAAIAALDQVAGGLSRRELIEVIIAMDHPAESARKLDLLRKLMLQPGMEGIVGAIEESGYLVPYSAADAVSFYLQWR
ncbi:MAG: ferritin-like domain-containing protein [Gammaproteobacteria bacterium]|nr:ferritin-like domain-containing protein [Gammaproteobacteria bacterium]